MEEHISLGWILLGYTTTIALILIGLILYIMIQFGRWTRQQRREWERSDAWGRRMEGKINRVIGKWDRYELRDVNAPWGGRGAVGGGQRRVQFAQRMPIHELEEEHAM